MLGLLIAHTTYLCIFHSYTTVVQAADYQAMLSRKNKTCEPFVSSAPSKVPQGLLARHETNGNRETLSKLSESIIRAFLAGASSELFGTMQLPLSACLCIQRNPDAYFQNAYTPR